MRDGLFFHGYGLHSLIDYTVLVVSPYLLYSDLKIVKMKWIKRFLILALLVLIVLQLVRPDKNDQGYDSLKAFIADTNPTDNVSTILKTSCYDCHTNQTTYPWYANVAPVSYWLDEHIEHGKGHLNFSEWGSYSKKRKDHKLEEFIEIIEEKEMPLPSYTWIHKDAILDEAQIKELLQWAQLARVKYSAATNVPQ